MYTYPTPAWAVEYATEALTTCDQSCFRLLITGSGQLLVLPGNPLHVPLCLCEESIAGLSSPLTPISSSLLQSQVMNGLPSCFTEENISSQKEVSIRTWEHYTVSLFWSKHLAVLLKPVLCELNTTPSCLLKESAPTVVCLCYCVMNISLFQVILPAH